MFNLLMFNADWSAGRVTVPLGRIFEYTDAHISAQFRDGSNDLLLDRLTSLPGLFCEEGTTNETAYVGQINRARITGNDFLLLEIRFDTEVPPLENSFIYTYHSQLDMLHDFEFSRNHWAVKDADLYRFLAGAENALRSRPRDEEAQNEALIQKLERKVGRMAHEIRGILYKSVMSNKIFRTSDFLRLAQ